MYRKAPVVKTLVLFGMPLDREAFDQHFIQHHHPLLRQIDNVQQVVVNRIAGAAIGESPFYVLVELQFTSEEAMQQGLNSESGQAMAGDLTNFASGGATVLFSHSTVD